MDELLKGKENNFKGIDYSINQRINLEALLRH